MSTRLLGYLLGLACLTAGSAASAGLVTFSSDPTGFYANGFESVDAPGVSFSAIGESSVYISPFEGNPDPAAVSFGQGFQVGFGFLVDAISMELGNDDLCCGSVGDIATLRTFLGGALVESVSLALNFNDLMDQTIGYAGSVFDSATIQYTTLGGATISAAVVIDNIEFRTAQAVPEPSTVALVGAALLGLGRRLRPLQKARQ